MCAGRLVSVDESYGETATDWQYTAPLGENELRNCYQLALTRPRVLRAACVGLGLHLTTAWFSRRVDEWRVVGSERQHVDVTFVGTIDEVAAYVRGYAAAWCQAKLEARGFATRIREQLDHLK